MFQRKDQLTSPVVSQPKTESAPQMLHSNEEANELFSQWYDQLAQIVAHKGGPQAEPIMIVFDNHVSDTSKHKSSRRPDARNLLIDRNIGSITIKPNYFQPNPSDQQPDMSGGITLDTEPQPMPEAQGGVCVIEGRKGMFGRTDRSIRAVVRLSTDAFLMLKNGEATLLELEKIDAVRLSPSARAVWYQYVQWFKQEGFFK